MFTPEQRLRHAVRTGDLRGLQTALDNGANPRDTDELGRNALIVAAMAPKSAYAASDRLAVVKLLVERNVPVNATDASGRTALAFAAGKGHRAVARFLVERGAQLELRDRKQRTALFYAVLGGDAELVEVFIKTGAKVDIRDRFRDTPLIAACAKGFDLVARRLVAAGADPTVRDQEGRSLRDRAAAGACQNIVGPNASE